MPLTTRSLSGFLRRQFGLVLAGSLIGLSIAAAVTAVHPPRYESVAVVQVAIRPESDSPPDIKRAGDRSLVEAGRLREAVIAEYGDRPATSAFVISYIPRPSTGAAVVRISIQSPDAQDALALARDAADLAIELADRDAVESVRLPMPPTEGEHPVAPIWSLNLVLGAVLGLAGGVVAGSVRDARRPQQARLGRSDELDPDDQGGRDGHLSD